MKYLAVIFGLMLMAGCGSGSSSSSDGSEASSAPLNGLDTAYLFTRCNKHDITQTATDLVINIEISSGGGNLFPNTTDFTVIASVINQDGTTLDTVIDRVSALGPGGQHLINITIPLGSITGSYVTLGIQADIFEEVVNKNSEWRQLSSLVRILAIPYST